MSIIKHVTLQKIVAHDFRYDPRTFTDVFMLNRNSTVSHMTLVTDLRDSQYHTCILKVIIIHFSE